MRVLKLDQMNALIFKTDQVLILYIAVDRFFFETSSFTWLILDARPFTRSIFLWRERYAKLWKLQH